MATCKTCGRNNQDLYKFCLGCGGELGATDVGAGSRSRRDETPGPKRVEEISGSNGHKTLEDAEWDLRDRRDSLAHIPPIPAAFDDARSGEHTAVGLASSARLCPTCGHPVPAEFAFCGQCGSRLDGDSGRTSSPSSSASSSSASSSPSSPAYARVATPSSSAVHGRLILIRPDGTEGGVHPLDEGENVIGRGLGSLFDADGYLSPRHAEIVLNAAGVVVRDTGSLNGVFVKLSEPEELFDGDVFRIGQELLRFDEIAPPVPLDDGTDVMGSPNPGYWGRLALIVGRDQDGSAFPLFGDSVTLGRERGDILFPEDGYVSGQHARVSLRDGRFFLEDLNSSNGTFIRVRGERVVKPGSAILIGQQLFRISY
ncbi:MAG TPA: FHA domain-containing protein [Polyangia bacterium]|nr:FHA domain-containing protein [Polyangia bacterium]